MSGIRATGLRRWAVTVGVGLLLAGCAADGLSSNPVERSFTWFSYLGGDDIRAACAPGGAERYRFVYNAEADKQIRTYDIALNDTGGAMESNVLTEANLSNLSVRDPLRPWRGNNERTVLTPQDVSAIRAALAQSGFDQPAPRGAYLRSDDFYWTVSACRDGRFHFNAYSRKMPQFERISFDEALFGIDPLTKTVPVNPPRDLNLPPFGAASSQARIDSGSYASGPYMVQVASDGMGLKKGLF